MGIIDVETKDYVRRSEVFADLFNYLLYQGKPIIEPDNLAELDTTEITLIFSEEQNEEHENDTSNTSKRIRRRKKNQGKQRKNEFVQKYRDVLKKSVIMKDGKIAYMLILGVENQSHIHYAMPIRNMLYDALNYGVQVKEIARIHKDEGSSDSRAEFLSGLNKDDKLTPVITLVVNFSQEIWDGPMSIHDMIKVNDESIMKYIPDYRINLISPISMSVEEIEKFKTDFKELAEFIHCGTDKNALQELVDKNEKYKHMDLLTANLINDITNSKLNLVADERGEVNMCVAIYEMRKEEREEGREEGRAEMQEVVDLKNEEIEALQKENELINKKMEEMAEEIEHLKKMNGAG